MNHILVKYGNLEYHQYNPNIEEIGCSFNIFGNGRVKKPSLPYSLHTEYSASNMSEQASERLSRYGFRTLATSVRAKKSDLWFSKEWAEEFADFIHFIISDVFDGEEPEVIEIHPPYVKNRNYEESLDLFFNVYRLFEENIMRQYSKEISILLENRNQSGNFLLSKSSDYVCFRNRITEKGLGLKLIVDIPQLYGKMLRTYPEWSERTIIEKIFVDLRQCKDVIGGFHICGKGHNGDFNDLFGENKQMFLELLKTLVDDIDNILYVVPEINSQRDFDSILNDIETHGIFDFKQGSE